MLSTTFTPSTSHPRSPWSGSQHRAEHRWQLDGVTSLDDVARLLIGLSAELTNAHLAGWRLVEPMRDGHLAAARASRRQRGRQRPAASDAANSASTEGPPGRVPAWRLRVVDEAPVPGSTVFEATAAPVTTVLVHTGHALEHAHGPNLPADVLAEVNRQVAMTDFRQGFWGVAPARVGTNLDLVAQGSALRMHAVTDGALVRTVEALTFRHAADDSTDLLQAAASYTWLAQAAAQAARAGGRLVSADDGLVQVAYDEAVRS